MKASQNEQNQKVKVLEDQLNKVSSEMNDVQLTSDMQKTENQTLKQVIDDTSKEVESLKKLCKVYETEGEKNDELETKLENISEERRVVPRRV